jgi:hypothetical protein
MSWAYSEVVSQTVNPAGKYIVRVLITNQEQAQSIFLQFQSAPSQEQIEFETAKVCAYYNTPQHVEEE